MGNIFSGRNVDELLSSYIDNEIKEAFQYKEIDTLIKSDPVIYKKYYNELLTKNIIHSRITSVEIPEHTIYRINNSIDLFIEKYSAVKKISRKSSIKRFFNFLQEPVSSRLIIPRFSFAVIITIFMILAAFFAVRGKYTKTLNPYIADGTENSIMVQAVKNFSKLISGEIKPQVESNDVYRIRNFAVENSNFEPFIPEINDFELIGCVCDEYSGEKLTHIVYKNNDKYIYIYEVPMRAVNKQSLVMPEQVSMQIRLEKFYMCDNVDYDECTLLVWFNNDMICASVSNMPKHVLFNKFASLN